MKPIITKFNTSTGDTEIITKFNTSTGDVEIMIPVPYRDSWESHINHSVSAYEENERYNIFYLIKENQELKKQLEVKEAQQKEFIEYLEDYIDALKQQKETVEGLDVGEEHILMILEEVLEKYKDITGAKDE